MKNTQLLLINDMCGYGKVALSAMLPVLSHMGYRIHNLPTALVSDTLNYPKFYIHHGVRASESCHLGGARL